MRSIFKINYQEVIVTKIIIVVIAIILIGYYFVRSSGGAKPEEIAANKKAGAGIAHSSDSDRVKVHYEGKLLDGTVFDSLVKRGKPISFGLNQVIKGWTKGVQLMVVGETMRFFIPAGYGLR